MAAVAYGADGLCIEANIDPTRGLGDDSKQAITPEVFRQLMDKCQAIWNLKSPPESSE